MRERGEGGGGGGEGREDEVEEKAERTRWRRRGLEEVQVLLTACRRTVPARAEPAREGPGGAAAQQGGGGVHPGVVPLPGGGGLPAQVTLVALDPLTARHRHPLGLPIAERKIRRGLY